MKEITLIVKSTEIICKGNIADNFEKLPHDLFNYLELGLISHTDFTVYMKLTQFYNADFGYAFPTISQLMIYTRIASKHTINRSIKNLVAVGLLRKGKTNNGNNVYCTYKPLSKVELYKQVPKEVQKLHEMQAKLLSTSKADKVRWEEFKQDQPEKVNH